VYALGSWLPKLMANAGYSLGSSLSFLLALNFGGMFGAILGGWLGDRFNLAKVVVLFFALAAVSISLLGFKTPMPVLYTLITVAGATTIGTQILLYASAAQFYGLSIRSTGLGWASGIGRNGAIVRPLLRRALLGINLPLQLHFIAFALPAVIAALPMTALAVSGQRSRDAAPAGPSAAKACTPNQNSGSRYEPHPDRTRRCRHRRPADHPSAQAGHAHDAAADAGDHPRALQRWHRRHR